MPGAALAEACLLGAYPADQRSGTRARAAENRTSDAPGNRGTRWFLIRLAS